MFRTFTSIGVTGPLLAVSLAICWSDAARAQLISETAQGDRRVCTYYGSETLPDDEVVARTVTVGAGQGCPATAPFRDPNAPIPPNARLLRDTSSPNGRVCVFEQAGIEYQRAIPQVAECAQTPALLDRELAGGR